MNSAFLGVTFSLFRKGKLSQDQFRELCLPNTSEELSKLATALYNAGRIAWSEYNRLVRAAERDEAGRVKEKLTAKLREAERYVASRRGFPIAQGGLPSLGKRRP
jgi:hypothetical protein